MAILRILAGRAVRAVLLTLTLSGCAALPPRGETPPTVALRDVGATVLGDIAARSLPPAVSGFQLLPVAATAIQTRLALAAMAERTLDVQTFELADDTVGRALVDALRAAAERGVRVRLLVDDLHSAGAEPLLSGLAAFDHAEVRLFNPFNRLRGSVGAKLFSSLDVLGRVNHRMHNKLFAADNAVALFGGRNMADTYFMRGAASNFVDLDILAAGPVVQALSASFDDYWNSAYAWPVDAIVVAAGSRDERRQRLRALLQGAAVDLADSGVPARFQRYATAPALLAARAPLDLTPAPATVAADPVDKAAGTRVADRGGTVRDFVGATTRAARSEVFVVSPYFVPGQLGMEAMRDLRRRGVALRLLTNSLAATDEPVVHAGYLRYRRPMLEIGVEIHELSPELTRERNRLGRFGSSLGMLHAKIIVVDRSRLFVGSMNLDSRSERYNTEVGVLIDSLALAADLLDFMDFESSGYTLRLDPQTQALRWLRGTGDATVVLDSEPEVGFWRRLRSRVLGALLPEDWL